MSRRLPPSGAVLALRARRRTGGLPTRQSASAVAIAAVTALTLGFLSYLVRPEAIAIVPNALHTPLHGTSTTPIGSVPTLLHAFAFASLSGLLVQRRGTVAVACAAWIAVELAAELVQQSAIRHSLLAALGCELHDCDAATRRFDAYVRHGTFDVLDCAAAALGGALAFAVLTWQKRAHRRAAR